VMLLKEFTELFSGQYPDVEVLYTFVDQIDKQTLTILQASHWIFRGFTSNTGSMFDPILKETMSFRLAARLKNSQPDIYRRLLRVNGPSKYKYYTVLK